jgi:hypothetical protein
VIQRAVHQIENAIRSRIAGLNRSPVVYATSAPSPQVALDIFKGEWSSALPEPWNVYQAGTVPLYAHEPLLWAISEWGGVAGCRVLELGPLEGMHTYVLEQRGAASVTAIEGNPRAYLRCLVVKEILGLARSHFLHGDFLEFLAEPVEGQFDMAVASGVLYHMEDPVRLLGHLSRACDRVYLWTHYFDAAYIRQRPDVEARFGQSKPRTTMGFEHVVYPYHYAIECFRGTFCGGVKEYSNWLAREDILRALRHFGFNDIKEAYEEPTHIHGPAFALVARRAVV